MLDFSRYPGVPEHTRGALERYVEHRIEAGGFLTAVLANDLFTAFARADQINRHAMFDIVQFIFNEVPSSCWGSYETVEEWLSRRGSESHDPDWQAEYLQRAKTNGDIFGEL